MSDCSTELRLAIRERIENGPRGMRATAISRVSYFDVSSSRHHKSIGYRRDERRLAMGAAKRSGSRAGRSTLDCSAASNTR